MNLLIVDAFSLKISQENLKQIKRDITRTYPDVDFFKTEIGQNKLLNVLKAFSNYYKELCIIII